MESFERALAFLLVELVSVRGLSEGRRRGRGGDDEMTITVPQGHAILATALETFTNSNTEITK